MRLLCICGALAAGEFAASFVPTGAEAWPALAILSVVVGLIGYGLSVPGSRIVSVFLAGMGLFFFATVGRERLYREKPWLRNRPSCVRRASLSESPVLRGVRMEMGRRLAIGLSHDDEAVALGRAILLGERGGLSVQMKRTFVDSGTMHVFAISGVHVLAVAHVLVTVLAFLGVPRRWAGAAAVPLVWGYVAVIGFAPSAVRAASMSSLHDLAPVFWRRSDGLRSWCLTYLGVHVLEPEMVENVGCALSFVVMLAIVLVARRARQYGKVRATLLMTVVVWAAGVPISAHVFGRVTPGGMLANLVMVGAVVQMVQAGTVGLAVSFLSERVAAHFNNLSAIVTHMMVVLAEIAARLPGGNLEVPKWTIVECLGWYAALALAGVLAWRRKKMI